MPSLARYEVLERIAVGGMAEVFRARALGAHGFEKHLAIKRILPDLARHAEFERRFIAEAKLAVTLAHANIVQVIDFGRAGTSLYIAMELVDGPNLSSVLRWHAQRDERLPLSVAMFVCMEVLKGLEFAHQRGVVHRDISPSNILLSRSGEVKIADFGIAKASEVGARANETRNVMGKWPYMSPEQTRGEELDARSDLFSMAIVAWELATGQRLFHAADPLTMVRNVCELDIPRASSRRADVPPALDAVLERALSRDPTKRFARAADMLRAFLDVCYEHKLVATGLELADVLGRTSPRAAEPLAPARWADSTVSTRGTHAGREVDVAALGGGTRVTETAAPAFAEHEVARLTLVPQQTGSDGMTVWEVHEHGAARRSRRATVGAAIAAAVVAGTIAVLVITRTSEDASSPTARSRELSSDASVPAQAVDAAAQARIEPTVDAGRIAIAAPEPIVRAVPKASTQPVARQFATFDLHVEPWAEVWLGKKKLADAPVKGLRLPYGRHTLRLVNPVSGRSKRLVVELPAKRRYDVRLDER